MSNLTPQITALPDRQIEDDLFYLDVRISEWFEMDAFYGDPEGPDPRAAADMDEYNALQAEKDRRIRMNIYVEDPAEPTLEERLGPWGLEWQIEQRERQEGLL